MNLRNSLWMFLAVSLLGITWNSTPVHAWTMVNQTLSETVSNCEKDYNQNGLRDCSFIEVSVLSVDKDSKVRWNVFVQIEEIFDGESDFSRSHKVGDIIEFSSTPLNPFHNLLANHVETQGNRLLGMVRLDSKGHVIPMGMKWAPVKTDIAPDGSVEEVVVNPWPEKRPQAQTLHQSNANQPEIRKQKRRDFVQKVQDLQ